uniref:Terpene synthase metal-binding domain-containing protein n=1 Tax=Quercus lobata TaxID=97700 RepID=A0A7N2QZ53_QUELO
MNLALRTAGYPMLTTMSFLSMGDIVTKKAFDWSFRNPKIITASSFEEERGHAALVVECYMKQYGVIEQVINEVFDKQVSNAWKDINEELMRPADVPMPLLMPALNLARVMLHQCYKEGDGYTYVGKEMKDNVTSVLIDLVSI